MAHQVPDVVIPDSLVVGDYWTWRVPAMGDYPAATWTLSFAFSGPSTVNVATGWTIAAQGNGTWLVTVTKAQTATYTAGRYRWRAYVTSGSERYEVAWGWILFEPNVAVLQGDQRTHAQKVLAQLEAAIEGRTVTTEESYSIGGRSIQKMNMAQLLEARGHYAAMVYREMHPGSAMPSAGAAFWWAR